MSDDPNVINEELERTGRRILDSVVGEPTEVHVDQHDAHMVVSIRVINYPALELTFRPARLYIDKAQQVTVGPDGKTLDRAYLDDWEIHEMGEVPDRLTAKFKTDD